MAPALSDGPATLLEAGLLPVEDLATLALREAWRPRPIYGAHRWFARRFGSAFRALLTAAATPPDADFWSAYYNGATWTGRTVLDPFVGGGTSAVEALRLGARFTGVDIDPVACAIAHFEVRAASMPDLSGVLHGLKREIGTRLAPFYRTVIAGEVREVLHYFWVQAVDCAACGHQFEAHPHYQLAYEAEGTQQWAFCAQCHDVQMLARTATELRCESCAVVTPIRSGPVRQGRLTCPACRASERLIDVSARTGRPPAWRLFAIEVLDAPPGARKVPLARRQFRPATERDRTAFGAADGALRERERRAENQKWIPDRLVPREGRADDRLLRYGYVRYRELFNSRQLLHLSLLAEAVSGLEEPAREAVALAFSDHLTTNCMMTHYAFGWRRLAPLFSVRAYRHITRPVEVNPWLDGVGRGTFPNAVRQVQQAITFARSPKEPLLAGGFRPVAWPSAVATSAAPGAPAVILNRSAESLQPVADASVDLVLTDPPYFDNIAYSELSDFFRPWLELLGVIPADGCRAAGTGANLAAKRRDAAAADEFQRSLERCFREVARVVKPEGRLVFTYQHRTGHAWLALARALAGAGLRPIQVLPLRGNGPVGLHAHQGASTWDAVFVAIATGHADNRPEMQFSRAAYNRAREHFACWARRLAVRDDCDFRAADQRNYYRACLVAAALGMFGGPENDIPSFTLEIAVADDPPAVDALKKD